MDIDRGGCEQTRRHKENTVQRACRGKKNAYTPAHTRYRGAPIGTHQGMTVGHTALWGGKEIITTEKSGGGLTARGRTAGA